MKTGTLSKTAAGYWRAFPGNPSIWMCNDERRSDSARLTLFQAADRSVAVPFGEKVSMSSLRYGLINADLPEQFSVALLVHLTDGRAEAFAADMADMADDRIARLYYCLYSGGGCSEPALKTFRDALGKTYSRHGQMIRCVIHEADSDRTIKPLFNAFYEDAQARGASTALHENEEAQRRRNEGPTFLTSMSILCQGYLAVVEHGSAGKVAQHFWSAEVHKTVADPKWWLDVISPVMCEFDKEWPVPKDKEVGSERIAVAKLIARLQGFSISELIDAETLDSLVSAADKAIENRLTSKPTR